MKSLINILSAIALSQSLYGCAYLNTFNQAIDLKNGSVAMDVKQRVVFSQKRPGQYAPDGIAVCAEPSPDALTVLGVSGGLTLNNGVNSINAAANMAEGGAFVGLRTQSIQLLRDAMYRLCEGYAAGAVSETDFAAMQRRYQSTMLGLISIEQLTRPVVASQVLLTSAAASQSGASTGDGSVDKAQQQLDNAKSKALDTQTEVDKAKLRYEKAISALTSLTADDATVSTGQSQNNSAKIEVEESGIALSDARRKQNAAEEEVRTASLTLRSAQAKTSGVASTSGALSAIADSAAKSAEHLTKGVTAIVANINESYLKDSCITLVTDLARRDKSNQTNSRPQIEEVLFRSLETCQQILAVEAEKRQLELKLLQQPSPR